MRARVKIAAIILGLSGLLSAPQFAIRWVATQPDDCRRLFSDINGKSAFEVTELWAKRIRTLPVTSKSLTPHRNGLMDGKMDVVVFRGIPSSARWITANGTIFRHYTADEQSKDEIQKSAVLRSGFTAYEVLAPGVYRHVYQDLTGVFLTLPERNGFQVGRPDSSHYVDVKLEDSLPVLEIEKGNIYLVALPSSYRGWVRDLYKRFENGESLQPHEREMCEKIKADGGILPVPGLPITVLGSK